MNSLRRQLTVALLTAFVLLIGGGGLLVYWQVRSSMYAQFDGALKTKALVVVTDTQTSKGTIKVYFSDRFLREFDQSVGTEFFQVFTAEGRSVARSGSLGQRNLPHILNGPVDDPVYWNLTLPNGSPGRAIGVRFQPRVGRNETPPTVIAVVAVSRVQLLASMADLRTVLYVCGGALLLLTSLVVPWLLRRGLRPLDAVAEAATRIDSTTLGQRFPVEQMPRELRPVGDRLNDLLSRLEAAFERERRFGSDLAHELRTPIAELKAMAEVATTWPQDRAPDMDQAVLEIAGRMESLVTRLLALGRSEQGRAVVVAEPVDLARLIGAVASGLESLRRAREVGFVADAPETLTVTTDPVMVRSILVNLLENAFTYSPVGSEVCLALTTQPCGSWSVTVTNLAPELRREEVARLFERFWRKDAARAGGNHAGLGLALCRAFAEQLGGTLTAELLDGDRLALRLSVR